MWSPGAASRKHPFFSTREPISTVGCRRWIGVVARAVPDGRTSRPGSSGRAGRVPISVGQRPFAAVAGQPRAFDVPMADPCAGGPANGRIEFGTGVTCPIYRYHPAAVAQAFASLAMLAPGRVFLGLGTASGSTSRPLPTSRLRCNHCAKRRTRARASRLYPLPSTDVSQVMRTRGTALPIPSRMASQRRASP